MRVSGKPTSDYLTANILTVPVTAALHDFHRFASGYGMPGLIPHHSRACQTFRMILLNLS
jgi:hypothetical protein